MKVWLCTLQRRYMYAPSNSCLLSRDTHRNCGWFEVLPVSVFVTSHGKHYHYLGGHLFTGSSKSHMNLAKAEIAGYKPCRYCFPLGGRRP